MEVKVNLMITCSHESYESDFWGKKCMGSFLFNKAHFFNLLKTVSDEQDLTLLILNTFEGRGGLLVGNDTQTPQIF